MKETPHKPRYINPFTDFGFKKIFGEEANKDLLIDFLNELLAPQNQHIKELSNKKTAAYSALNKEERKQKEEALDTIRKMIEKLHAKGLSISEIATITGKPESEIKKMLK